MKTDRDEDEEETRRLHMILFPLYWWERNLQTVYRMDKQSYGKVLDVIIEEELLIKCYHLIYGYLLVTCGDHF